MSVCPFVHMQQLFQDLSNQIFSIIVERRLDIVVITTAHIDPANPEIRFCAVSIHGFTISVPGPHITHFSADVAKKRKISSKCLF